MIDSVVEPELTTARGKDHLTLKKTA